MKRYSMRITSQDKEDWSIRFSIDYLDWNLNTINIEKWLKSTSFYCLSLWEIKEIIDNYEWKNIIEELNSKNEEKLKNEDLIDIDDLFKEIKYDSDKIEFISTWYQDSIVNQEFNVLKNWEILFMSLKRIWFRSNWNFTNYWNWIYLIWNWSNQEQGQNKRVVIFDEENQKFIEDEDFIFIKKIDWQYSNKKIFLFWFNKDLTKLKIIDQNFDLMYEKDVKDIFNCENYDFLVTNNIKIDRISSTKDSEIIKISFFKKIETGFNLNYLLLIIDWNTWEVYFNKCFETDIQTKLIKWTKEILIIEEYFSARNNSRKELILYSNDSKRDIILRMRSFMSWEIPCYNRYEDLIYILRMNSIWEFEDEVSIYNWDLKFIKTVFNKEEKNREIYDNYEIMTVFNKESYVSYLKWEMFQK